MTDWTPEQIDRCAAAAHYAYESAALDAGWETNPASRVPWNDVPASNKAATRAAATAVLSAVDLSDHDRAVSAATLVPYNERYEWHRDEHHGAHTCPEDDWLACMVRAVAADALRQAADDLIEAFPQTFRGEDGYLSARMYSSGEYAEWLRARAEAVGDE